MQPEIQVFSSGYEEITDRNEAGNFVGYSECRRDNEAVGAENQMRLDDRHGPAGPLLFAEFVRA